MPEIKSSKCNLSLFLEYLIKGKKCPLSMNTHQKCDMESFWVPKWQATIWFCKNIFADKLSGITDFQTKLLVCEFAAHSFLFFSQHFFISSVGCHLFVSFVQIFTSLLEIMSALSISLSVYRLFFRIFSHISYHHP